MNAAFKDICAALVGDSFVTMTQESIDTVDRKIASAFVNYTAILNLDSSPNTKQAFLRDDDLDVNLSLSDSQ